MYEPKNKQLGINSKYGYELGSLFRATEAMEYQYGDLSGWTTQQFAEFLAKNRRLSYRACISFKCIVKHYIELCGEDTAEISDLTVEDVYKEVVRLNIPVFWYSTRGLATTVRYSMETTEMRECGVFISDSIITASILLFCGLDFQELVKVRRDDVLRNGIWSFDFPTKIERNTIESKIIMDYARSNIDGGEEVRALLPLVRGGKSGRQPLTEKAYLWKIRVANGGNPDMARPGYEVTPQSITLSGEFVRLYAKIGDTTPSKEELESIKQRGYVKIQIKDIEWFYKLFCMQHK